MTDNCSALPLLRHDKIIRSCIAPHCGLWTVDSLAGLLLVVWLSWPGLVISNVVLRFCSGFCSAGKLTRQGPEARKLLGKTVTIKCSNYLSTLNISVNIGSIHHKFNWILLAVSCTNIPLFFHFRNCSFHSLIDFCWNKKKEKTTKLPFCKFIFFRQT